jgi:hypothetical protein
MANATAAFAPVQSVDAYSVAPHGTDVENAVQAHDPLRLSRYVPLIVDPALIFSDTPVAGHATHPGQRTIPANVT